MALINCPECGNQISDKAKFCPHCGFDPQTAINMDDFEIEDGVLENYEGIDASVFIPDSVTIIGERAFSRYKFITSISIPDSVTEIGDHAFFDCTGLKSIRIPNSVKRIGDSAFFGCTELKSIIIPDSVTSIGSSAFLDTAWYDDQPDGLAYAGKVAYGYKGTCPSSVTIKESTTCIAGYAFFECTRLTNISIPDSVIEIGEYAFKGCIGLACITIPNSVVSIEATAFECCNNLTIICSRGSYAEKYAKENGIKYKTTD